MTQNLKADGANVVGGEVDSTERPDIPPFGENIDYLTFGGIYREVALRIVPRAFIENVFAKPVDVLGGSRRVDVKCLVEGEAAGHTVKVELRDGGRVLASGEGPASGTVTLSNIGSVELWYLERPNLY